MGLQHILNSVNKSGNSSSQNTMPIRKSNRQLALRMARRARRASPLSFKRGSQPFWANGYPTSHDLRPKRQFPNFSWLESSPDTTTSIIDNQVAQVTIPLVDPTPATSRQRNSIFRRIPNTTIQRITAPTQQSVVLNTQEALNPSVEGLSSSATQFPTLPSSLQRQDHSNDAASTSPTTPASIPALGPTPAPTPTPTPATGMDLNQHHQGPPTAYPDPSSQDQDIVLGRTKTNWRDHLVDGQMGVLGLQTGVYEKIQTPPGYYSWERTAIKTPKPGKKPFLNYLTYAYLARVPGHCMKSSNLRDEMFRWAPECYSKAALRSASHSQCNNPEVFTCVMVGGVRWTRLRRADEPIAAKRPGPNSAGKNKLAGA